MTKTAQSAATQTWKLTLAYDGTDYPRLANPARPSHYSGRTAIGSRPHRRRISPAPGFWPHRRRRARAGSSRQLAQLQARIPPANLLRALNRTLPGSIRILSAQVVPDSFHARHSALAKTYEYRVLPIEPAASQICSPFLSRYVFPYSWSMDLATLNSAAAAFLGEHDFRSFAASDPDLAVRSHDASEDSIIQTEPRTAIRTIYSSAWHEQISDGFHLLVYRVRGNGFLHHMVRNLVGTMLDVRPRLHGPRRHPSNSLCPRPLPRRSHCAWPRPVPPLRRIPLVPNPCSLIPVPCSLFPVPCFSPATLKAHGDLFAQHGIHPRHGNRRSTRGSRRVHMDAQQSQDPHRSPGRTRRHSRPTLRRRSSL